jgi:dinuclear metal center YbgI/SA1388 family protein
VIALAQLAAYLDDYLRHADVADYPQAWNGLQLQNNGSVSRVAVAVDATVRTATAAAAAGADLLLVHHGLFWSGDPRITGVQHARISPLLEAGIALYSSHLPLDLHPEVGNAAVLARSLGVGDPAPFGPHGGSHLGVRGVLEASREELQRRLAEALDGPVTVVPGGSGKIRTVGLVTGGGGSFAGAAADAGLDALITGEAAHHQAIEALERGLDLFLGGHYATETWGVRALAQHLEERFGLPWSFIDSPSGL